MKLQHANVRIPPPFIFVAVFLAGGALERVRPLPILHGDSLNGLRVWLGWGGIACGLALTYWAFATFRRSGTTVVPNRPASTLVASGPYRFSRNPMYVGLSLLSAGLAIRIGWGWSLILLPGAMAAVWYMVIRKEEAYLTDAFGDEYRRYREEVRRWL